MGKTLLIIIAFITGIFVYPYLPSQVASHWNIKGEVDGYLPKLGGAFLMPALGLILHVLFLVLPKMDPYSKNIAQIKPQFDRFIFFVLLFIYYLYALTLLWNFGYRFDLIRLLSPAFSALFYTTSTLIEKAKQNWFIGIRTPWTLSSEIVWDKTHRLGATLFKITSLVTLLGVIFPHLFFYFLFGSALGSTVYLFFYSYYQYTKLNH